jgi:hypothetical protein
MSHDPVVSNKDLYRVVMENDRVRVLAYADKPGDRTTPHRHPDSVMVTLSGFRRKLSAGGRVICGDPYTARRVTTPMSRARQHADDSARRRDHSKSCIARYASASRHNTD